MTGPLSARLTAAPRLADPERAQGRLADLLAEAPDLAPLLGEGGPARDLLWALPTIRRSCGASRPATPARLAGLLARPPEESNAAILADQRAAGLAGGDVARALRRNRAAHALLVALADIGGVWSLEEVTAALSDFADASVSAAVDAALDQAAGTGRFLPPDPARPQGGSGLIVLGMGKLGAGELNYSSDVDLIVLFDPDTAPLRDGVEATPFFSRIAQAVAKLLQERTADGYVHRVDYRLRPDPGSTPTALSLASAYTYYETVGQNWERAAFIKARPVAGDHALADGFLAELRRSSGANTSISPRSPTSTR